MVMRRLRRIVNPASTAFAGWWCQSALRSWWLRNHYRDVTNRWIYHPGTASTGDVHARLVLARATVFRLGAIQLKSYLRHQSGLPCTRWQGRPRMRRVRRHTSWRNSSNQAAPKVRPDQSTAPTPQVPWLVLSGTVQQERPNLLCYESRRRSRLQVHQPAKRSNLLL
jgi:hypothetical protein